MMLPAHAATQAGSVSSSQIGKEKQISLRPIARASSLGNSPYRCPSLGKAWTHRQGAGTTVVHCSIPTDRNVTSKVMVGAVVGVHKLRNRPPVGECGWLLALASSRIRVRSVPLFVCDHFSGPDSCGG